MLEQTTEMPDAEEAPAPLFEDEEKEWAAVIAAAPAMARLPDMVAAQYTAEAWDEPGEDKEIQDAVRERVRSGAIFVFKLINNNVNKLFEKFDVRFGSAIDLLMDDLEATYVRDEGAVENYTGEEVCGRLFAYIAMESYCKYRAQKDPDDGSEVDEMTGFFKNMEWLPISLILESVLDCVKMTPEFKKDVRREATLAVHTHIYLLLDAKPTTVWH